MAPRNAAVDLRLGRLRAVDRRLLPALLAIAVGLLLAVYDGGFDGQHSYPAALFLLALLALGCVLAPPRPGAVPTTVLVALGALVAFALWALLSALWSDVPALAWDGANRIVLYAIVLALVALRRWPAGTFVVALGLVAAGLATIALGVLADSALSGDPARLFVDSRLNAPTGYANATASLWLIGVWPALALACGTRAALGLRAGSLGIACLLLEMSLLSVSRGALAATAVTALVFVALSGDRAKVLAGLAALAACALLAAGPLLAVSDAATDAELGRSLGSARAAIAWTCLLATAVAAAGILAGRRIADRTSAAQRAAWSRRAARASAALAALAATATLIAIGNPAAWVDGRWQDFTTSGYTKVGTGSQRITGSLGSGRYDYYRVALNEFAGHPLAGIGYGNFQVPYLVHRRTDEAPRYTHSLAFGVLSQLGLVGAALLVTFFAAALTEVRRGLAAARGRRTLAAGALCGFAVWFVHGLVDWVWEFGALGILAFALLGLAMRAGGRRSSDAPATRRAARRRMRRAYGAAGALATVAVAASFVVLGIAARLTHAALAEAPRDPAHARLRLDRAARLDRLAAAPLLTSGVLALRLGDRAAAEHAFERALEREPRNWFAELELGVLYAAAGDRERALRALAHAEHLNPRQRVIDDVREAVRRGEPVDPAEIERSLYEDQLTRARASPAT
jgi:hypothetical protein